jgi:hypothetical protein
MADLAPGQTSSVGLGFGHTVTMARSRGDTLLVIRGRKDVLRRCEARLTEPAGLDTWKRVYALELQRIQSGR